MQTKNLFIVAAVSLWCLVGGVARGDVLGSYTVTGLNISSDNNPYFPYAVFPVFVGKPGQNPNAGYTLFGSAHWTTADVGSTVTETPATSPDAASAIAEFIDGINEPVIFKVRNEGGAGPVSWSSEGNYPMTESSAFFPGGGGPDFSRFTITDVRETLNSMTLSTPQLGATTHATYTVTVDGTVPEPGAVGLVFLAAGLAFLCRQGHRKR